MIWLHHIAFGSVCELETQTIISGDLGYAEKEKLQELRMKIGDIEKMLKAMIKSPESKHLNPGIIESFLMTNWEKNRGF